MSSRKRIPKRTASPRAKQRAKLKSKGAAAAVVVPPALLDELVQRAKAVRENAHAPYSKYHVGASIATKSGRIFDGCNVENASFGGTICAERGAVMQMIAAGERDPIACAIVTEDGGSPCGICRQVLSEFAKDMSIVLVAAADKEGENGRVVKLADLLPLAFVLR